MSTFTVRGEDLHHVDAVLVEGPSTPPVTLDSVTPVQVRFTLTPTAVGDYTVVLKAGAQEVYREAAAFSVIAEPTVPTILYVDPPEVWAGELHTSKVVGWLLDPADCLSYSITGQGGGGNRTGLDFANTGVTTELSWGAGTWDVFAKQGGSGGAVIATGTAKVTALPNELVSCVPDTAAAGTATTYTLTLTGGGLYVGRIVLKPATGTPVTVDLPTDMSQNTHTTVTFTATLPAGVYDAELWYWPVATQQLLATLPDIITVT